MLKNKVKDCINKRIFINSYLRQYEKERDDKIENDYPVEHNDNSDSTAYLDIPNYLESPRFTTTKPLLLCVFHIVPNNSSPFLLYLLNKNKKNELDFIIMPSFDGGKHNRILKQDSVNYISKLFPTAEEVSYAGFMESNKYNIIFIKYVSSSSSHELCENNICWTTCHELVNLKKVTDLPICKNVSDFFIDHSYLLVLKNENDVIYTTPVIGYYILSDNNDDIYKKVIDTNYRYYMFYCSMPQKPKNTTIMRAALFLENPSLNSINDNIYKSDFSTSLIYNKKTIITYAISHYSQHIPLSYI